MGVCVRRPHRYTIRTNGTVFQEMGQERGRFDGTKFTERWDNVIPNSYWRNYWAFMNVQNAFDAAIISSRVRAALSQAHLYVVRAVKEEHTLVLGSFGRYACKRRV